MTISRKEALDPQARNYETFVEITSPLPCVKCGTLTTWGHVSRDGLSANWTFSPYCPLHGIAARHLLVDPDLKSEERNATVVRFVLHMQHDIGAARVIGDISANDIPGWHYWQPEDFVDRDAYESWHDLFWHDAWSVEYTAPDGTVTHFIVVYDWEWSSFHLVFQDGSVKPPQHTDEDEDKDDV